MGYSFSDLKNDIGSVTGGVSSLFNPATALGNKLLDYIGEKLIDYLSPDPDFTDRKIPARGPTTPRRVIYGRARVGGQVAYIQAGGADNEFLDVVYIVASHPTEAIIETYIGDTISTDSKYNDLVSIYSNLTGDGVLIPELAANTQLDPSRHKFRGLSYVYARYKFDNEVFQGQPLLSVVIDGKNDIYDPRTLTSGFTRNSALCTRDWLVNYLGASSINDETFTEAANDCDFPVPAEAGVEPRFELNGTITLSGSRIESLSKLIVNSGVLVKEEQGEWSAIIQKYENPFSGSVNYPGVVNVLPSPFDPEGWYGATNDPDGTITNTTIENPSGQSFVGLVEQTGGGFLRPFSNQLSPESGLAGETWCLCCIAKNINKNSYLFLRIESTPAISLTIRISDGNVTSISTGVSYSFEKIDENFSLIQIKYTLAANDATLIGRVSLLDDSGTASAADIGDQIYMQAAFFGKSDDFPAAYSPPAKFNESDLISDIQVVSGSNKQDKINTVKGAFISADNNYEQIEYAALESTDYITEDKEVLDRTIDYQMVASPTQCRRLSKITLEKSRFGLTASVKMRFPVWRFPVGSRIKLSYARFGWDERIFRVVSRDIDGITGIDVVLKEDVPEIYSWNEGDAIGVIVPPAVNLPNPDIVDAPFNLQSVESLYIANTTRSVRARATLTWESDDLSATHYEVEGSLNGGSFRVFNDYIVTKEFNIDDLELGDWIFRVRGVNAINAKSNYASVNSTIIGKTAPPSDVTGFTGSIKPFSIELSWDAVPDLDVAEYEIRQGMVWETATLLQRIDALKWEWETRPTGNETILIKAIDTSSNYSLNASVAQIDIQSPLSVEPLTAQVVDNNVLLRWADATSSFNVDKYEVRRGQSFSSGTVIGFVKSTFTSVFEVESGTYTYWVKAFDVEGNSGPEASVNANVDQPPDFILQSNQLLDLSTGTKVNLLSEVGRGVTADTTLFTADTTAFTADNSDTTVLIGPANLTETWTEHFEDIISAGSFPPLISADQDTWTADSTIITSDAGQPSIRQLQTDNGFPFYLQPTPSTASYEQIIDFGGSFALSRIQLIPSINELAGDPDVTFTIGYSADNISYTDTIGLEATGINFQYVRVKVEISTPTNVGLLRINSLRLRLDVKLKTDAGSVATDGTGKATVFFNVPFVDVQSIQVSPNTTTNDVAVYDFVDAPNPTSFDVLLFDNTGSPKAGTVSWNVRGV